MERLHFRMTRAEYAEQASMECDAFRWHFEWIALHGCDLTNAVSNG